MGRSEHGAGREGGEGGDGMIERGEKGEKDGRVREREKWRVRGGKRW